jgi:hypothetical protein
MDIDGDGFPDAIYDDEFDDVWKVYLNDRTGQLALLRYPSLARAAA